MCGFGLSLFSVGNGGSYRGAVWFGARWALEGRAILSDVFGRGQDETTKIVSGLNLVVWNFEEYQEDQEECLVHPQHVIIGYFCGDVSENYGGLFYHHQSFVGSHALEIIGRIRLGDNRAAASFWNQKSRTRG